jgi:hypothetical protein
VSDRWHVMKRYMDPQVLLCISCSIWGYRLTNDISHIGPPRNTIYRTSIMFKCRSTGLTITITNHHYHKYCSSASVSIHRSV